MTFYCVPFCVESRSEQPFSPSEWCAETIRVWRNLIRVPAGWVFDRSCLYAAPWMAKVKGAGQWLTLHWAKMTKKKSLLLHLWARASGVLSVGTVKTFSWYLSLPVAFLSGTTIPFSNCFCSAFSHQRRRSPGAQWKRHVMTNQLRHKVNAPVLYCLWTVCELRCRALKLGVPVAALGVKTVLERLTEITGSEEVKEDEEKRGGLLTFSQRVSVLFNLKDNLEFCYLINTVFIK